MSVIRHGVYLDELLPFFPDDARDVFLKPLFEVRTLPNGDGENRLNVDLCECVCHLLPPGHFNYPGGPEYNRGCLDSPKNNQGMDDIALLTEGGDMSIRVL